MENESGRVVSSGEDGAGHVSAVWRPVGGLDGVWEAAHASMGVPLRAVALRLADQSMAVYSPVRGLGAAAHEELARLGHLTMLIAPNHFHNMGIGEYAAGSPGVAVVASPTATARLVRRCGVVVVDDARLRAALPANVRVLVPPASRAGELWLSVPTKAANDRAWIVGDAFFNIRRTPRSAMGMLLWLLGISPGLRIATSFRWLIRDRPRYRRWLLDMIATERPTMLLPCHGDVLVDPQLPGRLERLVKARL